MITGRSSSATADNDGHSEIALKVKFPLGRLRWRDLIFRDLTNMPFPGLAVLHKLRVLLVELGKCNQVFELVAKEVLA